MSAPRPPAKLSRRVQLGTSANQALQRVLGAAEHEKQALDRAKMWRQMLNGRVAEALSAGVPAATLAENLGVTVQRIYQMRSEAPQ